MIRLSRSKFITPAIKKQTLPPLTYSSHYSEITESIRNIVKCTENATPLTVYYKAVEKNLLKKDDNQLSAVKLLEKLFKQIKNLDQPASYNFKARKSSFWVVNARIFKSNDFFRYYPSSDMRQVREKDGQQVYELKVEKDFDEENPLPNPKVKGAYIFGDVGCGKTLLMDLFYETIQQDGTPKIPSSTKISDFAKFWSNTSTKASHTKKYTIHRIHFHKFMKDVHERLAQINKKMPETKNKQQYNPYDLVPHLAADLAAKHWILCFDEFQVTDIADAMLMRRLFTELWKKGTIIVTTGNREIQDLYSHGLQYQNFKPFIPLMEQHCDTIDMRKGPDYRQMEVSDFGQTYFVENEKNNLAEEQFYNLLFKLTGTNSIKDPSFQPTNLVTFGRKIPIPLAHNKSRIAMFDFNDLCGHTNPMSSNDFITIAENFQVVFIKNLDAINLQTRRSEARRFISLIDNLYDNRIGVVFLSKVLPEDVFVIKDWESIVWSEEERLFMEQFYGGERFSNDDIMKDAGKNISFSMLSGDDEKFAVARLLSRMHDMKSQGYWSDIQRKMTMYKGVE